MFWVQLNDGTHRNEINKIPRNCFVVAESGGLRKNENFRFKSEKKEELARISSSNNFRTKQVDNRSPQQVILDCNDSSTEAGLAVDRETGFAITVRSSKLFNFSVQEYSTEALSIASHSTSLDEYRTLVSHDKDYSDQHLKHGFTLNLDPFLMGVGGDDSWSACVHEEFTLPPSLYSFKISMSFHQI